MKQKIFLKSIAVLLMIGGLAIIWFGITMQP